MRLPERLVEKIKKKRRLVLALACYGVLISAALYALLPVRNKDGAFILWAVLLVLLLLIIKTLAHSEDD
jgi:hypothetical protein